MIHKELAYNFFRTLHANGKSHITMFTNHLSQKYRKSDPLSGSPTNRTFSENTQQLKLSAQKSINILLANYSLENEIFFELPLILAFSKFQMRRLRRAFPRLACHPKKVKTRTRTTTTTTTKKIIITTTIFVYSWIKDKSV